MYDVIVHDDIFCTKEKRRQLHSTKSNMTTHLPPICPYTPPLPRPGASKYRTKPFASSTFLRLGLHYSLNHPDDGDDGSSSDRSGASELRHQAGTA